MTSARGVGESPPAQRVWLVRAATGLAWAAPRWAALDPREALFGVLRRRDFGSAGAAALRYSA